MSSLLSVDGVSNNVSSLAASSAVVALAGLLVASVLVARWLHGSSRFAPRPSSLWFAGLASFALIIAMTLFRDGLPSTFRLGNLGEWSSAGSRLLARDPLGSSQFVLNVVLFVPSGVAWTLISRRPLLTSLALSGLSLVVEVIQAVTGVGANDVADLVANSLGAAVGAAMVVVCQMTLGRRTSDLSGRSRRLRLAAGLATGLMLVGAWFAGASSRQQSVENVLRSKFTGTDRADIEAMLESDAAAVFGAADDYSNGTRYSGDTIEIRYPTLFFGLRRCVFVIWSSEGVAFRRESGQECTDFIDS